MKRLLEFTFSVLGMLLLLPIIFAIIVVVRIKMGRPVFYTQLRPGKEDKPFKMIKFRTMTNERDEMGELLPNKDRMTSVGSFLRSTSLDELPELINVIKGEMSLVGPRPLRMDYIPLYDDYQNRRHEVRPGITGWAQINGRNTISWEQKFEHDVWYVDNQTLWLDIKIILLTIKKVFTRDGVNQNEQVTMEPFKGSKKVETE